MIMAMRSVLLALLVLGAAPERAAAQAADYPSKPVTFVVPFAPGGVTSLFARLLGQKLEQRLGKPFVVENRPGGGGVTAAVAVAHAAPDGYTIMMASSTILAINVSVRKNLPYDPRKDLQPIALLARVPFVLVVNPDAAGPFGRRPGQARQGEAGPGVVRHARARHRSIISTPRCSRASSASTSCTCPTRARRPALQDRGRAAISR